MKKLLFPLAVLVFAAVTTLTACAQSSSSLDKFFDKYGRAGASESSGGSGGSGSAGSPGSAGINISLDPSFMLNASFSGEGGDNSGWLHKVSRVRLLILNAGKNPAAEAAEQEWAELSRSLKNDRYEELISVRKGPESFRLTTKEGKDGLKEIVLLTSDKKGGGIIFHFAGHFTDADMARIRSAIQETDSQ